MGAYKNITDQKYNRLTAIKFSKRKGKCSYYWLFKCDCGEVKEILKSSVLNGNTKSCGCLNLEKAKIPKKVTHNKSKHPLYPVWRAMLARVNNKKDKRYKNYGDRGVTICKEWYTFQNFYNDLIKEYDQKRTPNKKRSITLERIDVDKGYSPSNCRWATYKEQGRNKTNNLQIEFKGEVKCLSEWCDILDLPYDRIYMRIKTYGWTPYNALTK